MSIFNDEGLRSDFQSLHQNKASIHEAQPKKDSHHPFRGKLRALLFGILIGTTPFVLQHFPQDTLRSGVARSSEMTRINNLSRILARLEGVYTELGFSKKPIASNIREFMQVSSVINEETAYYALLTLIGKGDAETLNKARAFSGALKEYVDRFEAGTLDQESFTRIKEAIKGFDWDSYINLITTLHDAKIDGTLSFKIGYIVFIFSLPLLTAVSWLKQHRAEADILSTSV